VILIVAPEPVDWLGPTVEAAAAAGCGPVSVFAPWAIGLAPPAMLPGRLRRAWERRRWEAEVDALTRAGWWGADLALRAWARSRTNRLMSARFLRRRAADVLAARAMKERASGDGSLAEREMTASAMWDHAGERGLSSEPEATHTTGARSQAREPFSELETAARAMWSRVSEPEPARPIARARDDREPVHAVIAPSLAARAAFAATPPGSLKILAEDLPSFRQLHADLDQAFLAHPGCRFLRRYRAPASLIARQEAERVLADALLVRGRFAVDQRADAGKPVLPLPRPRPPAHSATPRETRAPRRVLLAGLATARNGSMEALRAFSGNGAWELVVRPGEGMEPSDLLTRPGVRAAEAGSLDGIDLVVAPSWCESYPDEVSRAAAAGIPVVATRRAAGFLDLDEVALGDADGLRAAAERARPPKPPRAEDPGHALRTLIRGEAARRMNP
jgi:hypothetical protein